ncbi:hypothetical protein L2E82_39505 [Cichorium intybus]|uniref:Uncharacterized protein n=1 Tax=Cichorium intybus TaxID=13427 RepID=A0ACB9AHP3_CICIN|nr:hypothetical protein L2E82_39505 [Cichorium intybus]
MDTKCLMKFLNEMFMGNYSFFGVELPSDLFPYKEILDRILWEVEGKWVVHGAVLVVVHGVVLVVVQVVVVPDIKEHK